MAFIEIPIETDPDVLKDEAVAYIQDRVPGWEAAAGNLETILIESIAEMAVEQAEVASQVPEAVFRKFGERIIGIPPIEGVEAIGSTTWTMTDTLGHVIPVGTQITIDEILFETSVEGTVPAGSPSTVIPIVAVEPGEDANDLTGVAEPVDTVAFLDNVTLIGTTSGGIDAETDDEYLNRLTEELTLMTPSPVLPEDFEILARRIAGVDRALAVDGFNPVGSTYGNEKMVAVAAVDDLGEAVSAGTKTEIKNLLESLREANFVVNTIDPTYTTISVTADVTVLPGFDLTTTLAMVTAAVTDYLQPYNFGRVSSGDGRFERPWVRSDKVAYLNIAEVIKRTEGVAFIESLLVNGGTTNIALTAAAPLTRPGTITIT